MGIASMWLLSTGESITFAHFEELYQQAILF